MREAGLSLIFEISEMSIRLAGRDGSTILRDHALLLGGLRVESGDACQLCFDIGLGGDNRAIGLLDP